MDNVISINNLKDNTIEFDIETQGFDKTVDISVRLVVSANPVVFAFNCIKEMDKWVCKIPAMAYLTPSAYPFVIEVIIDGYFFEALRGILNVTISKDVYVKIPKSAKTIVPPDSSKEEEEETPTKPTTPKVKEVEFSKIKDNKQSTKGVETLAKKIMADVEEDEEEKKSLKKDEKKKSEKKKEEMSEEQNRAIIIKEILNSVIAGKKPKTKFSIRD